jgi:hypothetical protein
MNAYLTKNIDAMDAQEMHDALLDYPQDIRFVKKYYSNKLWWQQCQLLILGTFVLVAILGAISYVLYNETSLVRQRQFNSYNDTPLYSNRVQSSTNYTRPIFRIYNRAPSYISNNEIEYGLMLALRIQLQRDLSSYWPVMGDVVFNNKSQTIVDDGNIPVIVLNDNLSGGAGNALGFHSISIPPNVWYAADVPAGMPYCIVLVPVICSTSMSHSECLEGISLVSSHELLETSMNPITTSTVLWMTVATSTQTLVDELVIYAEIADAVQGQNYITAAGLELYPVHNFVTRDWMNQLSSLSPRASEIKYDFMRKLKLPGQVSKDGYIPYHNTTNGCYFNYLPGSSFGTHERVVESCAYKRCLCPFAVGTIIGTDNTIDVFSFANIFGLVQQELLIKTILDNF